jgi:hypothetical protein
MGRPSNLEGCEVLFLDDGHLVIAYPETEVILAGDGGLLLSIPVAYYDEEWEWLHGANVIAGAEPQDVVVAEAKRWARCLTFVPLSGV